jgi:hypothetical protein
MRVQPPKKQEGDGEKSPIVTGEFGDRGRYVTIDGRSVFIETKESLEKNRKRRDDEKAPFLPKNMLDHAIVDYIGNHKKMVEGFKPFIEDAYKVVNQESKERSNAIKSVLGAFGHTGKQAYTFIQKLRKQSDYDKVPGFDEMAEYAAKDQENLELYAAAKLRLEEDTAARITQILQQEQFDRLAAQSQLLGSTSALFGELAGLAKNFGGEQSSTFKALFAASKGFAIADAGLKLNMAILQAMADPTALSPQQKLANYAAIAAAGGSLISAISSASYGGGRQYGGPVSAGSMYRVNETGAPEMFVGSGGRQYMMPTTRGEVVPADQVGGAGGWTIIVNEAPAGMRATVDAEQRIVRFAVDQSKAEIAGEIASNTGGVWRALSSASTVRPKL